jgi:hypothetical protein
MASLERSTSNLLASLPIARVNDLVAREQKAVSYADACKVYLVEFYNPLVDSNQVLRPIDWELRFLAFKRKVASPQMRDQLDTVRLEFLAFMAEYAGACDSVQLARDLIKMGKCHSDDGELTERLLELADKLVKKYPKKPKKFRGGGKEKSEKKAAAGQGKGNGQSS